MYFNSFVLVPDAQVIVPDAQVTLCKKNWAVLTYITRSKHQDTGSLLENVNSFSIYIINSNEKRSWSKRFNMFHKALHLKQLR